MSDNFTFWLVIAVGISAVALASQAICVFLMYRMVASLQQRVTEFMPRADKMVDNAERMIAESRQDIVNVAARASEVATKVSEVTVKANLIAAKANEVAAKANEVMDIAQTQAKKIDGFVDETTVRARAQFDRIETVVDDSLGRVQHSVGLITDTATRPAREINAVTAGVRAAVGKFFERQRRDRSPSQDEEHEPVGRP